jgi:hypothetical protein
MFRPPAKRPRESTPMQRLSRIRSDVARQTSTQLRTELPTFSGHQRVATADLLIRIAEFDLRKLYLPEGYPTMTAYCMEKLNLSEDEISRRLQAARAGRDHPILLEAFADSRIHLSGLCLLAPYLNSENEEALVAAATGQSVARIKQLLAERFPRPEMLPVVPAVSPVPGVAP